MSHLNDLKREHNRLMDECTEMYTAVKSKAERINQIRSEVKEIEGDEYDPIPLIFGAGFDIHEDDE